MAIRRPYEVRAIQAEWYQRLKDDGFRDIESATDPDGPARDRYWSPLDAEGTAEYYRLAGDYFRRTVRDLPNRDRQILALHVQGAAYREIARTLSCSKRSVEGSVRAFRARMQHARRSVSRTSSRGRQSQRVHVRLPDNLGAWLQSLAKHNHRTLAHTVYLVLEAVSATPSKRDEMAEIVAEIAAAEIG